MAATKKITSEDLKAIVQAEIANCEGQAGSELVNERADNLNRYFARAYGNEQDGRSSVVSPDVRDTIEWAMPTLIRMLYSENIVEFAPEEPGDIEAAKQATEYVNFIWDRDNTGFLNTYTWIKDTLLSKNGLLKIYWNTSDKVKRERYSGLDDATFAQLVNDKTVTVSEHTENVVEEIVPDLRPNMPPQVQAVTYHDLVISKTEKCGRVVVDTLPTEEFLISKDARCIKTARMVGHRRKRTISDLIEDGFDRTKVDGLASSGDAPQNEEEIARNTTEDNTGQGESPPLNHAMREVEVYEVYIKIDMDGDGIAEMRKVTAAGPGYTILDDEAWDAPVPFVDLKAIINCHRWVAIALADITKIWQLLRTTVLRQYLDNLYLSNNQREEVVSSQIIEPTEALSHKPGQKIRVKALGSIQPIVVPQIGSAAIEGLNYLDQLKENATGLSARTQGLGSNQLHDTLGGEQMLMTAAMGKIELMARVMAETGFKEAFKLILKLVCMYQDQPRTVRLTGKEFVPVDPQSWNADMDMTVSVGAGTGDRQMQMQGAGMIGGLQEKLAQLGMVTPEQFMQTAEMVVEAAGQKGVERFFTLPDPNAPPKPDPEMAKVQAETQAKTAQMQMEGQIKTQQMQAEGAIKTQTAQADMQLQQQRLQAEMELKRYQTDQELALKREQLQAELILKREQMAAELALKREMGVFQMASGSSDIGSNVNVGGEPG